MRVAALYGSQGYPRDTLHVPGDVVTALCTLVELAVRRLLTERYMDGAVRECYSARERDTRVGVET